MLINLEKIVSKIPVKTESKITTIITKIVNFWSIFLVGQETFLNSTFTSRRNSFTLGIRKISRPGGTRRLRFAPVGHPLIHCSFSSQFHNPRVSSLCSSVRVLTNSHPTLSRAPYSSHSVPFESWVLLKTAGLEGLEPPTLGFGVRRSTS